MTQPTSADVHVNQALSDWAVKYGNSLGSYKARLLAPAVPSKKRSNKFYTYDKAPWFTDEMQKRGEGGAIPMSGFTLSTTTFDIDVWSLGKSIDDQERDNEDDILDADQDAAQFLMEKEYIRREKAFAAACLATSKWSTDVTGNTSASNYASNTITQWNYSSNVTILEDVTYYRTAMKLSTGLDGNVLVLGRQVWDAVKNDADILDRISGGSNVLNPAKVTTQMVAGLMELDEIVVMDAVENTANAPAAMTGAFIAGKSGLLMHRNMNAGRKGATAVKTLVWQRPGADQYGVRVNSFQDGSNPHLYVHEMEANFTIKICATDLGIFFTSLVA